MKPTQLIILMAIACASHGAYAKKINKCKQPDGHVIMTDRPCGDPATERHHAQSAQNSADEISAGEVFDARKKIGNAPRSPELIDSRGVVPSTDHAPATTKGQD